MQQCKSTGTSFLSFRQQIYCDSETRAKPCLGSFFVSPRPDWLNWLKDLSELFRCNADHGALNCKSCFFLSYKYKINIGNEWFPWDLLIILISKKIKFIKINFLINQTSYIFRITFVISQLDYYNGNTNKTSRYRRVMGSRLGRPINRPDVYY